MKGLTIKEGTHAGPPEDRRDLLTAGISIAATLLAITSSWTVTTSVYRSLRGGGIAMLMIDLDHFKSVNDLHGHIAGDQLLRAASQAITDPLPAGAIAARLGGDEFACAFPFDPITPGAIDGVAEAIIARMGE